jgi:holo-[acyl-carrier protein] synthase
VAADLRLRVGIDVIGVQRMERLLTQNPEGVHEIFTPREVEYCRSKRRCYEHLAARFSAKEAVLKAFGTGVSQRMRWQDVEVVNDVRGRPRVKLSGAVAAFARRHGLSDLDVSLTHAEGLAIAQAVAIWTRSTRGRARCASI